MCCSLSNLVLLFRLVRLFDRFAQKYALHPLKVRSVVHFPCYTAITPRDGSPSPHQMEKERHTMNESNFVVKTIFHSGGRSEVLTENYFVTRKEAEEFCALTDYAMKLNYGAEQQLVTTEIVAL